MNKTVYAFTEPGFEPGFINISEAGEGYRITVRSSGAVNWAEFTISADELAALWSAIGTHDRMLPMLTARFGGG